MILNEETVLQTVKDASTTIMLIKEKCVNYVLKIESFKIKVLEIVCVQVLKLILHILQKMFEVSSAALDT